MGEPIYVETWEVAGNRKGDRLDIAYTRSMCPTVEMTDIFRRSMAETHRCVLCKLLRTRKIEYNGTDLAGISKRKEKTDDHVTGIFKNDNRPVVYLGPHHGSIDI